MNSQLDRVFRVAALAVASACVLLLPACGNDGPLDARAAETQPTSSPPPAPDPALNNLEGVTHHG